MKHSSASVAMIAIAAAGLAAGPAAFAAQPASTASVSRHRVERVQAAFDQNGAALAVDGILGPNTRAALRKYQRAHDLPVTGRPSHATVAELSPLNWQPS